MNSDTDTPTEKLGLHADSNKTAEESPERDSRSIPLTQIEAITTILNNTGVPERASLTDRVKFVLEEYQTASQFRVDVLKVLTLFRDLWKIIPNGLIPPNPWDTDEILIGCIKTAMERFESDQSKFRLIEQVTKRLRDHGTMSVDNIPDVIDSIIHSTIESVVTIAERLPEIPEIPTEATPETPLPEDIPIPVSAWLIGSTDEEDPVPVSTRSPDEIDQAGRVVLRDIKRIIADAVYDPALKIGLIKDLVLDFSNRFMGETIPSLKVEKVERIRHALSAPVAATQELVDIVSDIIWGDAAEIEEDGDIDKDIVLDSTEALANLERVLYPIKAGEDEKRILQAATNVVQRWQGTVNVVTEGIKLNFIYRVLRSKESDYEKIRSIRNVVSGRKVSFYTSTEGLVDIRNLLFPNGTDTARGNQKEIVEQIVAICQRSVYIGGGREEDPKHPDDALMEDVSNQLTRKIDVPCRLRLRSEAEAEMDSLRTELLTTLVGFLKHWKPTYVEGTKVIKEEVQGAYIGRDDAQGHDEIIDRYPPLETHEALKERISIPSSPYGDLETNTKVDGLCEEASSPKSSGGEPESVLRSWETWIYDTATYKGFGTGDITYPLLGLVGELGELVNSIVRHYRKSNSVTLKIAELPADIRKKLKDESYDALHFLMFLLKEQGITLDEIVRYGWEKLEKRVKDGTVHSEIRPSNSMVGKKFSMKGPNGQVSVTLESESSKEVELIGKDFSIKMSRESFYNSIK